MEMAAGLPFGVGFFVSAFDFALASALPPVGLCLLGLLFCDVSPFVFGVFGALFCCLKSSVTGGRAWPPLTASSLVGLAGCMVLASSFEPVAALSGRSGSPSCLPSARLISPSLLPIWSTEPGVAFMFGVAAGVASSADSGIVSLILLSASLRSCSPETVFFSSAKALPSLSSLILKLPRRNPALLSLFNSDMPLPIPSSTPAICPLGSTETKLLLTFDSGLPVSWSPSR